MAQGLVQRNFTPIYKKGNVKECSNYRTINLMVHASKVLLKIIVSRIQLKYLSEINEKQSGFVKGKGTREQMVNIRIIMEKYKEYNIPLYMCFIDYAKAFDCVNHQLLRQDMQKNGLPSTCNRTARTSVQEPRSSSQDQLRNIRMVLN